MEEIKRESLIDKVWWGRNRDQVSMIHDATDLGHAAFDIADSCWRGSSRFVMESHFRGSKVEINIYHYRSKGRGERWEVWNFIKGIFCSDLSHLGDQSALNTWSDEITNITV